MGTRHLICVVKGGDYRIAQYGQYDGHPDGRGKDVAEFVARTDMAVFSKRVSARIPRLNEQKIRALFNKLGEGDFVKQYPQLTRSCSAEILDLIVNQKATALSEGDLGFAADSLFCEWVWLIDLDKKQLECFKGFNKIPLEDGQRFKFLDKPGYNEYRAVRFVCAASFKDLKRDGGVARFIAECNKKVDNAD